MHADSDPNLTTESPLDLQARHARLQQEMVERLEQTAVRDNYGLLLTLLGWEHLVACAVSHYFVEVAHLQRPYRWPYLVVWLAWAVIALATVRLVRGRAVGANSPLLPISDRIWAMFFLLCADVVILNITVGLPVFVFLPVLATLASFALAMMTILASRRFLAAIAVMFVTGMAIARFPAYGFLIYGVGWLVVLQTMGIVLWCKRRRSGWPRTASALAHSSADC
jgi:hypothetical protein